MLILGIKRTKTLLGSRKSQRFPFALLPFDVIGLSRNAGTWRKEITSNADIQKDRHAIHRRSA